MVKLIYIPGIKRQVRAGTWEDIKDIVEETIKKHKKFLDALGEM